MDLVDESQELPGRSFFNDTTAPYSLKYLNDVVSYKGLDEG
jgi:hypothetical protein